MPGGQDGKDGDVDRRSLLPLAAVPVVGLSVLAELLTPVGHGTRTAEREMSTTDAAQLTARTKTFYQDGRYQQALDLVPALVLGLTRAAAEVEGDDRVFHMLADTYHVIASILLKLGDGVLAMLAAQRSLDAALHTSDPVIAACSARIVTHALMEAGHHDRAISLAMTVGRRLRKSSLGNTPVGLSVFGALALRAAVAAARSDDRRTATELLNEAEAVAVHLGHDVNDRWTGFGPANVQLHRVHVALTLGDAGSALAMADHVDVLQVKLAERKASFLCDVARAYLARERAADALAALEKAFCIAPEEIATRPQSRRIYGRLEACARGPVRDRTFRFGMQAGLLRA